MDWNWINAWGWLVFVGLVLVWWGIWGARSVADDWEDYCERLAESERKRK